MRTYYWIRIGVLVALVVAAVLTAIPVILQGSVAPYIHRSIDTVPRARAALVLGASVRRGKPSPILEQRVNAAVELYRKGRVDVILMTGDNGADAQDEVTPVRKYLRGVGIPSEDIFLDHAGFDTYSSMYRARDVFLADSVVVVTQDFHMPRALFLARALGLEASGFVPKASGGDVGDYVREIPASIKAALDVIFGRVPRYLGDTIPLSGDGSRTWF